MLLAKGADAVHAAAASAADDLRHVQQQAAMLSFLEVFGCWRRVSGRDPADVSDEENAGRSRAPRWSYRNTAGSTRAASNEDGFYLIFSSFSTLPSRMWMMRWACMAMSCFVGHQHDGVALLPEPLEQAHDFVAGGAVRGAGGLVGQQDGRIVHQRPRHRDALPLAAGKLVGLVVHARFQIHRAQRRLGPLHARRRRICPRRSAAAPRCAARWRAPAD